MIEIISMGANLLLAGLLVSVIVYCKTLSSNIKVLQDSKSEMAKLFAEFDQSIDKASNSIFELKEAARKSDVILKEKLDTANMIADDLSFMIERGNRTADQLEGGLKGGRAALSRDVPAAPPAAASAPAEASGLSRPTKENLNRLQPSGRSTASIESVLEQMANRNNPAAGTAPKPGEAKTARVRSKAEQELLDSLKGNRS